MCINDERLSRLFKGKNEDNDKNSIIVVYFDFSKTIAIILTKIWDNVEYLSLRNNYLKEMSFIQHFPMLFYLDLTGNPIEDFEVLNKCNSFGYLGLTAPLNFLEKNILTIKGLNIGILEFEIKNQLLKEQFYKNNPNVFYFNGYCYSFNEKIILMNEADNSINSNTNSNTFVNTSGISKKRLIEAEILNKKHLCPSYFINSNNNHTSIKDRFYLIDINPRHPSLKDFLIFIDSYNKNMMECTLITNEREEVQLKLKKMQQKGERKRLLMLGTIYRKITNYLMMPLNTFDYNKGSMQQKKKRLFHHYINSDLLQFKSIPMQLLILSIIYLYIIGIFSNQICIEILYCFHLKYTIVEVPDPLIEAVREDIKQFFNLEYFYIICFYYDIYSSFLKMYKELKMLETEDEKNRIDYGAIRYTDLRKSLKMLKLTMIITQLEAHHKSTGDLFKMHEAVTRNDLIQTRIINFLLQEDIYKETLQIVQFVNDFLLLNKYEAILVKDLANDYRLFHEIKEQLYKNISTTHDSLSEKKYNEIKMKTLANKYFFKTKQYTRFTLLGNQMNRFYIFPKPTFYPVKPIISYRNSSVNDTEQNKIQNTLKLSQDLQNSLSIKLERKKTEDIAKTNEKRKFSFAKPKVLNKELMANMYESTREPLKEKLKLNDPILLMSSDSNRSSLSNRINSGTKTIYNQGEAIFYYKEMKQRKSQSVTCLFSKAKKLPKIQLRSLKPIHIEHFNSNYNANKLFVDKQNVISFRLNANPKKESNSNTHSEDSCKLFEPRFK